MANEQNRTNSFYHQLLGTLKEQLKQVPEPLRSNIGQEIEQVIELMEHSRLPRFAMVGRTRAGKSTLLNAIFERKVSEVGAVRPQTGASSWQTYTGPGGEPILEILDTRGFQEGMKPKEADQAKTSEESILNAFREAIPDVVLFVVKAKEVNAAIEGDLQAVVEILETVEKEHGFCPMVVGILTQCDELDPPYIKTAKDRKDMNDEWTIKQQHIDLALTDLRNHFEKHALLRKNAQYIAVSSFVRFRPDGTLDPDPDRDWRWNIEELKRLLIEEIPEDARLQFSRAARVRHYQRKYSRIVVGCCAAACGLIGAEPIPFADMPVITSIQLLMIVIIAYISGRNLSLDSARDFLAAAGINVGVAFALRELARGSVKLIPGAGNVISGGIAGIGTTGLGEIAIAYFVDGFGMDEIRNRTKDLQKKVQKAEKSGAVKIEIESDE